MYRHLFVVNYAQTFRNSHIYRIGANLWYWSRHSVLVSEFQRSSVQQAIIGLALFASLVNILSSQMNAAVKFLSFAVLFVVTAAFTWSFTDPLPE